MSERDWKGAQRVIGATPARRPDLHGDATPADGGGPPPMPMSIVILTAHTGAGHDSTAQALAEALPAALPRVRVRVWNPLGTDAGHSMLRIGAWYDTLVALVPHLWGLFYHLTDHEVVVRLGTHVMALLCGRRLRALLRGERPCLVVSVHPLCARLAAHALRHERDAPPHHCVVTDLVTVHRCWACPRVDAFYVATAQAARALAAAGIPPEHMRASGLPLRRPFTAPPVAPPCGEAPSVLLLGSRRASRAFVRAARTLLTSDLPLRLVIVCGDERLRLRLERLARDRAVALGWPLNRATILGWQRDVAALMRAASVVVTKAGSVTLAEAISQARPVLIYQVLAGQEEGNAALLERRGLCRQVRTAEALPAAIVQVHQESGQQALCCAGQHAAWWGAAADRVAAELAATVERIGRERQPIPGFGGRATPPGR